MKNKKCAAGAGTPNSANALQSGSSSCLTKSIVDMLQKGKLKALKAVKRKLEEFNGQQFLGELSNGKA